MNYKAARAIKAYLRERRTTHFTTLFLNKYGKPLSNRSVEKALKKYARAAGISWAHVHTPTSHQCHKTHSQDE